MPTRHMARRLPRTAPRRRLNWANFHVDSVSIVAGDFQSFDLLHDFKAAMGSVTGATITRVHLRTWVTSTVVTGDGLSDGLIVDQVDEVAATATPSATAHVLSPVSSPDADWMLVREWNAHPTYSFESNNNQWLTDVKSRRRLHEIGDTLIYVIENRDASAAQTFSVFGRILLMMP